MSESAATTYTPLGEPRWRAASRFTLRRLGDGLFKNASLGFGLLVAATVLWIGLRLYFDSGLTRDRYGFSMLTSAKWDVPHEHFGILPIILGTIASSALALIIAVPLSVGAALFLTEVAPRAIANVLSFVIELLAAIPSVVFGLWGFLVLCPFLESHLTPWMADNLGANPLFAGPPRLTNMLVAGVILAVMILPIITAITREVLLTVPVAQREASLGLGATKWETIRHVLLPTARGGITGAVILGLGRALGETMAVVMVIGSTVNMSASILQPGYTMPALLANEFNEAYNNDLHRSALLEVALTLFVITLLVNGLARLLLLVTRRELRTGSKSGFVDRLFGGFESAARYGFYLAVVGLIGLQFVCDIRAHGAAGLLGPVEVTTLLFIVCRFTLRRLSGRINLASWRALTNVAMNGTLVLGAFVACVALGAVLLYVTLQGVRGLNWDLFTQLPHPAGIAGGGLKNAICGTVELVGIAAAIGIPIGLMSGIYVAEFGGSKLSSALRYAADVLNGIPSVVIGLFAYAAFVLPFKHFSGWAGAGALAIMMIPTIMRTTEEMLRLVPDELRAGSMALGASEVCTVRRVILPAARSGILTGIMLAVARIAGETAPLLFTAFGSEQMAINPSSQMTTLTMKIYYYAMSPYDDWVAQAWAGALVLLLFIMVLSILARLSNRRRFSAAR